jgi:hypothetical protein
MELKKTYEYSVVVNTKVKIFRKIGNFSNKRALKCATKFGKWYKRYFLIKETYGAFRKPVRKVFYSLMAKMFGVQIYLLGVLSAKWSDGQTYKVVESKILATKGEKGAVISSDYEIEVS